MKLYIGKTSLHLTEDNLLGEINLDEWNDEKIKTVIQYDDEILPGELIRKTANAGLKTEKDEIVIG
jgi:hypothetical protein